MRKRTGYLLECLPGKAAARESAQKLRRHRLSLEDAGGPVALRRERGDGLCGRLVRDLTPPEIRPDSSIAVAASREPLGTALRQTDVVEEPSTAEGHYRILPRRRGMSGPRQPSVQGSPRAITCDERPGRRGERSGAANLAPQLARRRPVQPTSDAKPSPDDDIRGQDSPRQTVELHGHPAVTLLA